MKISKKTLQELKNNKKSIIELNDDYFISQKGQLESENVLNLLKLGICTFKEIVDKFKSIKDDYYFESSLYKLFNDTLFLKLRFEGPQPSNKELQYLLNETCKEENEMYLKEFLETIELVKLYVEECSFQMLVNTCSEADELYVLLGDEKMFKELSTSEGDAYEWSTFENLNHLLEKIEESHELTEFCKNSILLEELMNKNLFDLKIVNNFNSLITDDEGEDSDWYKEHNLHNVFEVIEYFNKSNKKILKLNEMTKYVYRLDEDEKLKIVEILRDNEVAQEIFKSIVDNHLLDQYKDFKQLKSVLTKEDNKKLKTKFNF